MKSIRDIIKNENAVITIIYAVGVMLRFGLSFFQNHIFLYTDEILFLEASRSLARGESVLIRQIPHVYSQLLYPLTIAPIHFIADASYGFVILKLLNSLIMNSAVFPAYMLAKKIVPKHSLLIAAISLLIPDMCLASCVLAEVMLYPVSLWFLLFAYKCISNEGKNRNRNLFLLTVIGTVMFFIKAVSLYYTVGFFLFLFWKFFVSSEKRYKIAIGIFALIAACCFYFLRETIFIGYDIPELDIFDLRRITAVVRYILYYFTYISLAFGIYFIVLPLFYFKSQKETDKNYFLALISILFTGVLVVILMVAMSEDYPSDAMTPHLRYFFPLIIPFCALFLDVQGREADLKVKILSILYIVLLQWGIVRFSEGNYTAFMSLGYLRESLLCPFLSADLGLFKIRGSMFDILKVTVLLLSCFASYLIFKSRVQLLQRAFFYLFIAVCVLNNILCCQAGIKTIHEGTCRLIPQIESINSTIGDTPVLLVGKYAASEKAFETYTKQQYYLTTVKYFKNTVVSKFEEDTKLPLIGMQWGVKTIRPDSKVPEWTKLDYSEEVSDPLLLDVDVQYIVVPTEYDVCAGIGGLSPVPIEGVSDYRIYRVCH